jgi:hypothetical protein
MLSVSEAKHGLVQPLMLPVWLELSGLLLLTFGLSAPRPVAKPEPKKKAKSRKKKPCLGKGPQPSANVVPLRRRA